MRNDSAKEHSNQGNGKDRASISDYFESADSSLRGRASGEDLATNERSIAGGTTSIVLGE